MSTTTDTRTARTARTARAARMAEWQRSLVLQQSYADAARICAAEDAAAALMADRRAAATEAAAQVDPAGRLMIVAEVKGDAVVSSLHLKTCTGGKACPVKRGTIGRPIDKAHPAEVARATTAPCAL